MMDLKKLLQKHSLEGELYEKLGQGKTRCLACAHRCVIPDAGRGICQGRFNQSGVLKVPYGYVSGAACDPIEKKPFFHVLPGSSALSFGMLGCNFSCSFCQNHMTSQALKNPLCEVSIQGTTPEELVNTALRHKAKTVVSTYNEPLITSEWAVCIFKKAREAGLRCGYVSNGYATPRTLEYIRPYVDFYKVDLKGFDEDKYRKTSGGELGKVLDSIRKIKELGFWIEIVTLIIPGFNDSSDELRGISKFIASVSTDIPWHVTAFHPDYRMENGTSTPGATLIKAVQIGKGEGLKFVYAGNIPGIRGGLENTCCPNCGAVLVKRLGYFIQDNRICALSGGKGSCPDCSTEIPGVWT